MLIGLKRTSSVPADNPKETTTIAKAPGHSMKGPAAFSPPRTLFLWDWTRGIKQNTSLQTNTRKAARQTRPHRPPYIAIPPATQSTRARPSASKTSWTKSTKSPPSNKNPPPQPPSRPLPPPPPANKPKRVKTSCKSTRNTSPPPPKAAPNTSPRATTPNQNPTVSFTGVRPLRRIIRIRGMAIRRRIIRCWRIRSRGSCLRRRRTIGM